MRSKKNSLSKSKKNNNNKSLKSNKINLKNISLSNKAEIKKINGCGKVEFVNLFKSPNGNERKTRTIHEGCFKNGKLNGKGLEKHYNVDNKLMNISEGIFKNGILNGIGKITRVFPWKYVENGTFKNGDLNGKGKHVSQHRIDEGEYKNGVLIGNGIKIYKKVGINGVTKEEGTFKPKLHGLPGSLIKGKKTYKNGMVEEGSFKIEYDSNNDDTIETLSNGKRTLKGKTDIIK